MKLNCLHFLTEHMAVTSMLERTTLKSFRKDKVNYLWWELNAQTLITTGLEV